MDDTEFENIAIMQNRIRDLEAENAKLKRGMKMIQESVATRNTLVKSIKRKNARNQRLSDKYNELRTGVIEVYTGLIFLSDSVSNRVTEELLALLEDDVVEDLTASPPEEMDKVDRTRELIGMPHPDSLESLQVAHLSPEATGMDPYDKCPTCDATSPSEHTVKCQCNGRGDVAAPFGWGEVPCPGCPDEWHYASSAVPLKR